jgi:hypothetical protein
MGSSWRKFGEHQEQSADNTYPKEFREERELILNLSEISVVTDQLVFHPTFYATHIIYGSQSDQVLAVCQVFCLLSI